MPSTLQVFPGIPSLPGQSTWVGPLLELDSLHTWLITVNGVDITEYVDSGSVAMTDAEGNEVDTLYFELVDSGLSLSITSYQEVFWIIDPDTASELVWFGGFVINAEKSGLDGSLGVLWRIKCEGWITLLARLRAPLRSWINSYPGDIVVSLLDEVGLTSQDSEQGTLDYLGNDTTTAALQDDGQTWSDWDTSTGDAAYAVVVTNSDETVSWGFLGELSGSDITVYQDVERSKRGWLGVLPVAGGKTPASYHVRRSVPFSGHRPIDTTNVQTGDNALLSFGATPDETVSQTIARLAKTVGWVWRVDGEAALYFGEAVNDPAPFNVSDGDNADYDQYYPARAGSLSLSSNGSEIRNRVVIHGGSKESLEITDIFLADGIRDVFQLSHRNLIDISVYVDGVLVADGTVWWHTFVDRVVLVNYAEGWIWFGDPPADDSTIVAVYRYWLGLEYVQSDAGSIALHRQTFTYELVDRSVTTEDRAQELATQLLADYADPLQTGSFEVWRLGLRAGQDVKLKFDNLGIDTGFTIRKMDCRIDPTNTGLICYCEFGGRQTQLSDVTQGVAQLTDQILLGQFGPLTAAQNALLAKPITGDVQLARRSLAIVDANAGDVEVTLPPAITRSGSTVVVVKVDASANSVDILSQSGEDINGGASVSITGPYEAVICYSDGTGWYALRLVW